MVYGEILASTAVAADGFRFEKWLVAPDGAIENPKLAELEIAIRQNLTISPLFVPIEDIPIRITPEPSHAGYGTVNDKVNIGQTMPIDYAQQREMYRYAQRRKVTWRIQNTECKKEVIRKKGLQKQ